MFANRIPERNNLTQPIQSLQDRHQEQQKEKSKVLGNKKSKRPILHPKFQKIQENVNAEVVEIITVELATIVIIAHTRACVRHVISGPMWKRGDVGGDDGTIWKVLSCASTGQGTNGSTCQYHPQ